MKVSVKFTVNVNEDAWAREYGLAKDEVREDVQDLAHETVLQHLMNLGLLAPRKYN